MAKVPKHMFFNDFYFWFNSNEKEEYYATPLYLYCANKKEDFDNKKITVYLEKDILTVTPTKEPILKFPALQLFPYAEKMGMFLVNFLNANLNSFEESYNTFFFYYGFEILRDICSDIELKAKYETEIEFLDQMKLLFSFCQDELLEYQEQYRNCVDFVYNIEEKENLKGYKYNTRLMTYLVKELGSIHNYCRNTEIIREDYLDDYIKYDTKSTNQLLEEIEQDNSLVSINNIYKSNNVSNVCYFTLENLVLIENIPIRKCKNCGKYFLPTSRLDEIYCEYTREDGSTCKEIGAKITYKNNVKSSKVLTEYKRIYQKKLMVTLRNKDNIEIKDKFEFWKKEAKYKVNQFKRGTLDEDIVYKWLIENE